LKNVLIIDTHEYCKQHPKVPRHPGGEPLAYSLVVMPFHPKVLTAFLQCLQLMWTIWFRSSICLFFYAHGSNFTAYVKETDQSSHLMQ